MPAQRPWQRIMLLTVLGYEGLGALVGGILLAAKPDGQYMSIPVGVMHGAFRDFLIPGIILFALGLLNIASFIAVLRRTRADWLAASLASGGFMVWFLVEIAILRELHWLHAMWGFPVILGGIMALPLLPVRSAAMRNAGLICGIASSLLYVAMNLLVPTGLPDYSATSQTVSELSAVGVPTRPIWVVLGLLYTLLVTGFGWSVRVAAGDDRRLRIAGTLIAVYGALGIGWTFAPMHTRSVLAAGGGTFSDTTHLTLAALTVGLYLVALGFAASALGGAFRIYSIASFAVLLVFAILTFRDAPAVGANQPTPLIGVWERVNIGVFLVWVVVLAVALLRRKRSREARVARARRIGVPSDQMITARLTAPGAP